MTETTARIAWHEEYPGTFYGRVGTLESWGFELWQSPGDCGDYVLGDWVLTVPFVFADRCLMNGRYTLSDRDPEKLKTAAERLLGEFTASLGAAWPDEPDDDLFGDEAGEPLEVKYAAGRLVRYAHPGAGYPGEAENAAAALILGEVYTIGWADIGQSRTNLNLYRDGKPVGSFNSVFFELADAPATSAPVAAEE